MRAFFADVKKKDAEQGTDGKFYGYVLYSNKLTVDQFKELFKNNKEFMTDVIVDGARGIDTKPSGEVVEMYVYVPQVSDFLPEPDLGLLNEFISLKKDEKVLELLKTQRAEFAALGNFISPQQESEVPADTLNPLVTPLGPTSPEARRIKKNSEAQRIYKKLRESLNIITMYPRVYRYTEKSEYYATGTACEVEFPNDVQKSMLTMGYGIYKKQLTGKILLEGADTGVLEKFVEASQTTQ
tara:strand:- start:71 stop:790 length:720 start_codon:yes stop_codon:yes gene_type:complete